jgi:hypothetical protein
LRDERVREKSVAWEENSMDERSIGGLIDQFLRKEGSEAIIQVAEIVQTGWHVIVQALGDRTSYVRRRLSLILSSLT